ncbi:MAG: TauD/TfdA dioxygenase family protein [Alphaproteobacteria bacterium]
MITVTPSGQACGAAITGIDLTKPLDENTIADIRAAWLEHHVLSFPDQPMNDDDLERFTLYFGEFGHDPFFAPIDGRNNIAAIQRNADETTPLFAENWHTDWSFQAKPPIGTCLMAITIPPKGGDTMFANQHMAYEQMPEDLRARVQDLTAIHSAAAAYAPDGMYTDQKEEEAGRSMRIVVSDEAYETQEHPLVRPHTETGKPALYSTLGYITRLKELDEAESAQTLVELYHYQSQEKFQYRHEWQENMLILWDNRSVLHKATGGYEGYDRLLHRTTISERV